MNLFYTLLSLVMVFYNCVQGIRGGDTMNYALAAMWLAIGIFCGVKYLKDRKNAKKKHQNRQREE